MPRGVKLVVAFLIWTAIGVLFGLQFYSAAAFAARPVPMGHAIAWQLIEWYAWALLSPGIFFLARRFYPEASAGSIFQALVVHTIAAAACVGLQPFFVASLYQLVPWANPEGRAFADLYNFTVQTHFGFLALTYAKILAVALVIDFWRRYQDERMQAASLERQLIEARLQALQMQLQPHFLFNTLNAISSLVHSNPGQADRMISRLGDLLRATLTRSDQLEVPLHEEIELTERYLEIERVRFGERLAIRIDVPEKLRDILVPNLLLQPLVENAIRHGISFSPEAGLVAIIARHVETSETIELEILDNGPGPHVGGGGSGVGVGLENSRSRLAQLYGDAAMLRLEARKEGGTRVLVRLPLARAASKSGPALSSGKLPTKTAAPALLGERPAKA